MQSFIDGYTKWATCNLVAVDTTLLTFGLILVQISWTKLERVSHKTGIVPLAASTMAEYARDCCEVSCHVCSYQGSVGRISSWFDRGRISDYVEDDHANELSSLDLYDGRVQDLLGDPLTGICLLPVTQTENLKETQNAFSPPLKSSVDGRLSEPLLPPNEIAYILSTSGTTGRPVSVKVPHCSIVPNVVDLRSRFELSPDDVIFNASPLTFDPSIVEVSERVKGSNSLQ